MLWIARHELARGPTAANQLIPNLHGESHDMANLIPSGLLTLLPTVSMMWGTPTAFSSV